MSKLTFVLAALCMTATAYAGDNRDQKGAAAPMSLVFEDVRAACQSPSKFHNQVAPQNIQIACRDTQYKWVPASEGTLSLDTGRTVTASLVSDKYSAPAVTSSLPTSAQLVTCARYKQVAETIETIRSVSCDEVVAFNGGSIDFCAGAASTLRAASPEAITLANTGKMASLCGDSQRSQRSQHADLDVKAQQ